MCSSKRSPFTSVWKPFFSKQVLDKPQFSSYCNICWFPQFVQKTIGHLRGLPFHVDRMIQNSSFGEIRRRWVQRNGHGKPCFRTAESVRPGGWNVKDGVRKQTVFSKESFFEGLWNVWNWFLAMSNWKIPEAPCRFSAKRTSFLGFRPIGGSLTKICATNTATTTKVQKAGERKPDICELGQNEGTYIDTLICFQ